MTIIDTFRALYDRDLKRLAQEIDAYADEASLWQTAPGISNPAGNLCLHLLGNLRAYIGDLLGQTPYGRNRDAEFSTRYVPKATLLADIDQLRQVLDHTFASMTDARLTERYPTEPMGYAMTTHYFLTHLLAHLSYHLGQIDYHRRLLTGSSSISFLSQ